MLLLRLIAFGLSATQLVSSWLWPNHQRTGHQQKTKSGKSGSSASSSMTQTNESPNSPHEFRFFHYENRFYSIALFDKSGHIPYTFVYELDSSQEVFSLINQAANGSLPDRCPDTILDPRGNVKNVPRHW